MRLTKYRHACVLVEDGDTRVLIDPGAFTPGFEDLAGLTAVLVTHQHPDHVDVGRLPTLLERNPGAALHTDEGTAGVLAEAGIEASVVHAGDVLDLGLDVTVHGGTHGIVHPDVPVIPNVAYLLGGRVYHPGDSWAMPSDAPGVDVLCLPIGAPWIATADAVDFMRAVHPRVAVAIHEALLAEPGVYSAHFERLKPAGTEFRVLEPGTTIDV